MMLLEYLRFFGWVFRKMDKMIKKIWAMSGVLRSGVVIPRRNEGPHHGVAERRIWPASGTLQRSTVHSMENFGVLFFFCFSVTLRTCLLD